MDTTTLVLAAASVILLILAFRRGSNVALDGLLAAWGTLRRNLVLLILGFVLAGLAQVLIPRRLLKKSQNFQIVGNIAR